ncbi:MAG: glycoside hydrolase family 2 TIM barrel-domain containing protein [bacterium]
MSFGCIVTGLLLFLVSTETGLCVSGVNATRTTEALCDAWTFHLGDAEGADKTSFDDSKWRTLDLPHDWSIELPFDSKMPGGSSVGYLPGGLGWYRKTFAIPETSRGKQVFVDFDGVYMDSTVWINGHLLGGQPYGYTSFQFELTPYLKFGGEKNVIAVRVNVIHSTARWYPGAGIYRRVWLTTMDPVHIGQWGTYVTTPEISSSQAVVRVRTQVANQRAQPVSVTLKSIILDQTGKVVAETSSPHAVTAGGEYEFDQQVVIREPRLWSVDSPQLYQVVSKVDVGGRTVDDVVTPLGIRSIEFTKDRGFILNGKRTDIKGVCLHHDFGCTGTAFYPRALEHQLEILRDMGCNAIRTSHNPQDPEFYTICDRMGFLVMDEAFDEWKKNKLGNGYGRFFDDWSEKDLSSMVRRDRNHPSVILWSIGNEINEQYVTNACAMSTRLVDIVKKHDLSRPVTAGCNSPEPAVNTGFEKPLDVFGFNYNLDKYEKFKGKKPLIGSENATSFSARGCYPYTFDSTMTLKILDVNNNVECSSYGLFWGGNRSEETLMALKKSPWVAGQFAWTGFDYLGECFPFNWPAHNGQFGIIDLVGFPKDVYYLYQSCWTEKPMVHLVPQNWNWSQYPGRKVPVWVYSNCEEVELFLNGKSLGSKKIDRDKILHFEWLVPWAPGILKAVGRNAGKEICSNIVQTAGAPNKVVLASDRAEITADGWDLSYVEARIVDANGTVCPNSDMLLKFKIEGAGTILGIGNGDAASMESFKGNSVHTYRGLCRVVIKSTKKAGTIQLTGSAEGLKAATVDIVTKPGPAGK